MFFQDVLVFDNPYKDHYTIVLWKAKCWHSNPITLLPHMWEQTRSAGMIKSLGKNCERCTKGTPSKHTPPTVSYCSSLFLSLCQEDCGAQDQLQWQWWRTEQWQGNMQLLSQKPGPNLKLTQGNTSLRAIPSFVLYHTWGIIKAKDAAQCKSRGLHPHSYWRITCT